MRLSSTFVLRAAVAGAAFCAALTLTSCGKKNNPNAPSESPTPAPTPAPVAQPSPTPAPGGPGLSNACKALPTTGNTGTQANCNLETSVYAGALGSAIDSVSPDNLDGDYITYVSGFFQDVIKNLDAQGYCAVQEGDNLFVRAPGDGFNEYFDVVTSRGDRAKRYTNTCRPPVPTPQIPTLPQLDPTCKLPPSTWLFCGQDGVLFSDEMDKAIGAVIAEDQARSTPTIFDFSQKLPGSDNGYKVINIGAYHTAVMNKLREKGFCAHFDGEEIQLKNSNRVSAHWDIIKAEGFKIQLWAGTCRDAAF